MMRGRNAMIEGLEGRTLFAGGMTIFVFDADDSASTYAVVGMDRGGTFVTPSVRPNGSIRVVGTETDDAITVERTVGVHEQDDGAAATSGRTPDGEFDIVNVIGPDGSRAIIPIANGYTGGIPAFLGGQRAQYRDEIRENEAFLKGATTGPGKDLPNAEEVAAEAQARIDAARLGLARLDLLEAALPAGDFVRVTVGGAYDYYVQLGATLPADARLTIDAGAGNDAVTVSPNVPLKATINGGSGADVLTTGKKTSLVYAGGGKDRLISRSTKGAMLDGGQGADRYFNRTPNEVNVIGRADGDTMVFATGSVPINRSAYVGNTPNADGLFAVRYVTNWASDSSGSGVEYVKPIA